MTTASATPPAAPAAPSRAAPSAPPAVPTAPSGANANVGGDFSVELSHEQLRSMSAWEVRAGRLTQAQADEMLKADGVQAPAAPSQIDIDLARLGFQPAAPTEYQFNLASPGTEYTPELQKLDASIRDWFSTAKLPSGIGNAIVKHAMEGYEQRRGMTFDQREQHTAAEVERLKGLYGAKAGEMVQLARDLIAEVDKKKPGFAQLLEDSGALSSAFCVAQFAEHALRLSHLPANRK